MSPMPRAQLLVACAALLGYRFEARVLAACCDVTEAQALCVLRRACRRGLFVCESARERRYRFCHALYRSAIRESLEPARANALHARIATTLEALSDPQFGSEILAYHWSRAGDGVRARRCRRRAAVEARRLGTSS
ncbi:MAG: hypothetical protein JO311_06845 [Candidatus Eremiobacteraeota bacterium]|nr:hypothetical protein [Candidatus Eremiobacteraeota bacterium]MBV9264212.1 hypothetical protein [Candidatus Eremiobacteraeota bacterium]